MKYLEMTNEERQLHARHRASPSVARTTATTVAVSTAGILTVAVLGWFTAGEAGVAVSAGDAPVSVSEPSSETDWAQPSMRRAIDGAMPPPPPAEQPAARSDAPEGATPSAATRPPAPEPKPAPAPEPEASLPPVPAAVPTVRQGAPCPTEGDSGVTRSGNPAVCRASLGNSKARWRHA